MDPQTLDESTARGELASLFSQRHEEGDSHGSQEFERLVFLPGHRAADEHMMDEEDGRGWRVSAQNVPPPSQVTEKNGLHNGRQLQRADRVSSRVPGVGLHSVS